MANGHTASNSMKTDFAMKNTVFSITRVPGPEKVETLSAGLDA